MSYKDYIQAINNAYLNGCISESVRDCFVEHSNAIYNHMEEHTHGLPKTYAEIEYEDFDSAEAVDGARFDDMNYLRYTER